MNQPDPHPNAFSEDLHATREALRQGRLRPGDVARQAAIAAQSEACRHVFMPQGTETAACDAHRSAVSPSAADTPGALSGIPVSIKDLFDVQGQVTTAGSTVLLGQPAAQADCPAVARLRAAGAVMAGRTNMVEFAFSGVGINPHYGTPVNPADPWVARIPGGSSSGAAVSVAAGAALVGLGSDTGGSIRIPAALCGIVGFKSTARLVPTTGAVPLSTSLDTACAMTRSVRDAITVHEVLAARRVALSGKPLSAFRLAVANTQMQDHLDPTVSKAFERALKILRRAGARIEEVPLAELSELSGLQASGGFSAAESYAWHRKLIATRQAEYDPRVAMRILRGASMSAADYLDLLAARQNWIARLETQLSGFDAVISPTVPIVAPPISALLHDDAEFFRINGLLLGNTSVVNMLDGCAISIPCHIAGELPVGLMLWHGALHDDVVLDIALQTEATLKQHHSL